MGKATKGDTLYSKRLFGDDGNYKWDVTADVNARGYVGINQPADNDFQRVILTRRQFDAIAAFVRAGRLTFQKPKRKAATR